MSTKKFAATLFLCVATAATCAQDGAPDKPDTRTPLERYRIDGDASKKSCQLLARIAALDGGSLASGDGKTDFGACIARGKAKAKANFDAALDTVTKAQAREALKTYHVALVAAIEGVKPGVDERKISYNQRQQALEQKVTEAWARFEIEN